MIAKSYVFGNGNSLRLQSSFFVSDMQRLHVWLLTWFLILYRRLLPPFGCLRIWAIWDRNWLVLLALLPFSLFSPAINLYQAIAQSPSSPIPLKGCVYDIPLSEEAFIGLSTTSRTCAIVSDTIILVATLIKTWSIRKGLLAMNLDAGDSEISLPSLLLRDGTVYFATLLTLNIATLVIYLIPELINGHTVMPPHTEPPITQLGSRWFSASHEQWASVVRSLRK